MQVRCMDGEKCIAKEMICNGHPDCSDKSDEYNCGELYYVYHPGLIEYLGRLYCTHCNWLSCLKTFYGYNKLELRKYII